MIHIRVLGMELWNTTKDKDFEEMSQDLFNLYSDGTVFTSNMVEFCELSPDATFDVFYNHIKSYCKMYQSSKSGDYLSHLSRTLNYNPFELEELFNEHCSVNAITDILMQHVIEEG